MGMTREEAYDDIVEKIALIADTNKGYVKNALINAMGGAKTEVNELPSVTPQLSSELEKNSKKLEKDFGESDCISRTRAIERLKLNLPISQGADNSRDRHRYMQALADIQAIREMPSAKPQEPTTKNDLVADCISKKAVFEAIDDCNSDGLKGIFCSYDDGERFKEYIKNLPSVTPQEPRKGHWIGHREHCENLGVMPSGLGAYKWCSNCDCGIDVREWHRNHYNYCPNCGCCMVESQESEG